MSIEAGFTLLFAAIATVTIGTIIVYVVNKEANSPLVANFGSCK